jgi:hypothetical protein
VPSTPTPVPPVPPAPEPVIETATPTGVESTTLAPVATSTPTATSTTRPTLTPSITPTATGQATATSVLSGVGVGFTSGGSGSSGPGGSGGAPLTGGGLVGGGLPTPTFTPVPPSGPAQGMWTGTTSQGRSVTFTVEGTQVRALSMGWTTAGCAPTSGQSDLPGPFPIGMNNSVAALGSSSGGTTAIVNATITFTSPTAATAEARVGTINLSALDPSAPQSGCSSSTANFSFTATAAARP